MSLSDTTVPSRGVETRAAVRELRFRVGEMDCPSCLAKIEGHLSRLSGVCDVRGSVLNRTLSVTIDEECLGEAEVRSEVGRLGYLAQPLDGGATKGVATGGAVESTWASAQARRAYVAAGIASVAGLLRLIGLDLELFSLPLYPVRATDVVLVTAAGVGGWTFFPKGVAAARRLALDMNFLMTVAIIGAVVLGEFVEAAAIAVLFGIAELLEAYSVDRARASITALMELAPPTAMVLRDGVEVRVGASSLEPGDVVVVRPGDRIAADGTVLEGASAVDQSPITGESMPVDKDVGDGVFAGTINREGRLRIRVDRPADDSALAKIVHLIEEAEATKSESERFVERFARYYTPVIAGAALVVAVAPPLLAEASVTVWVTRALTLLVIACPCALVISTPVAVVSGLTAAARHGVLIKGGAYLEAMGSVRALAIDKTGTLTVGHPVVRAVIPVRGSEDAALARAAALERYSEHPLARAIIEEARRKVPVTPIEVSRFQAMPGDGARALLDGAEHVIGRPSLFGDAEPPEGVAEGEHSIIGLAREEELLAWFLIADRPRERAKAVLAELRRLGVGPVVMLTGDNHGTAQTIGAAVGVDDVRSGLLPGDKLDLLRELEERHGPVAMVGDGVNDGPALAAATVGIAMGAAGSDTALETADVALMGDDLERLPYLVRLSRKARAVIRQNIAAAIGVKAVLAIGVPLGLVSLITAVVVGDLGVSLAVTANALRLGRVDR
jgi:Cd2+/Zn2+-exporting ATPase